MDSVNVRNLEQIQEEDRASRSSRLGALLLASLGGAALVTVGQQVSAGQTSATTVVAGETSVPDCVRLVIAGSDRVDPGRVRQWHAGPGAGIRLLNCYGATECGNVAVMHEGRIVGELSREQASEERIIELATTGAAAETEPA